MITKLLKRFVRKFSTCSILRINSLAAALFLSTFQTFELYKLRVSGCGKGKSGGLRVIFSYEKKKDIVLLIRVYRKAEKENMSNDEIVQEIIHCLESL